MLHSLTNGKPIQQGFKSIYPSLSYLTSKPSSDLIEERLLTDGYCLFRNTGLKTINDLADAKISEMIFSSYLRAPRFDNFRLLHNDIFMNYQQGTDVRHNYGGNILDVSSNAPNSNFILHHAELCYTDIFPRIITFICLQTDSFKQGYTPFSNLFDIATNFDPIIKDKLLKYGIKYLRLLPNDPGCYGKTWKQMLNVETKEQAEQTCEKLDYHYKWEPNDCLRLEYIKPAFIECNDSNEISFANSIVGMHGSNIDNVIEWHDVPYDERPYHAKYGNNEEFTYDELVYFNGMHSKYELLFEWQIGDILILNNLHWSHARYPYEGERKIVTAMGLPLVRSSSSAVGSGTGDDVDIGGGCEEYSKHNGVSKCEYQQNIEPYVNQDVVSYRKNHDFFAVAHAAGHESQQEEAYFK